MHLSQGMVSFSLMSNTPPPLPSRSLSLQGEYTLGMGQQKQCCVSRPPGLNAAFMRPGWFRSDWVTWSGSCWHTQPMLLPPPQSSGIKKSFGVRTMGLSISLSFPASHPLHTVNFAYFHITSIKLHSLEPRHRVQHIVATVVNIAVHSWNDKNKFFNRVTSGITYCLLRAQISLRLLLWSYAHRRSLLRVRPR